MKTPECQVKSLSLDEAIAHAEEVAGDCGTACKREHKQLADWLRELKSRRGSEHGDTAKLREALENCANMGEQIDYQLGSSDETVYAFRHERCLAHNISECARTALATPPRNCDIAQDWLRDLYVNFKPPASSVKREMPPEWVDAVMAFCRWLVAPAAEKEGGAK